MNRMRGEKVLPPVVLLMIVETMIFSQEKVRPRVRGSQMEREMRLVCYTRGRRASRQCMHADRILEAKLIICLHKRAKMCAVINGVSSKLNKL